MYPSPSPVDTKVAHATLGFHEPFGEPFYYSDERMSRRYTEEQCQA